MPWQDAEQENETRKKQEEVMREKLLAQEAKKQEKVSGGRHGVGWAVGGTEGTPVPLTWDPPCLPRSGTSGSSRS